LTLRISAEEVMGEEEDEDLELTEGERDMLRQENKTLHHNFQTLMDKTKEIEMQVLEISHLQSLFADKVAQQKVRPLLSAKNKQHTFHLTHHRKPLRIYTK